MTGIRDVQMAELELLRSFVAVCEKYGLRYYIGCGTLLGAVRHNGYIPWDDDTDVLMPRPDYEKFLRLAGDDLLGDSYIESIQNVSGCRHYPAKLASKRISISYFTGSRSRQQDIWMDIFPMDGLPNGHIARRFYVLKMTVLRTVFVFSNFNFDAGEEDVREHTWYKSVVAFLGRYLPVYRLFSPEKRLLAIDKALKRYQYDSAEYVANVMGAYKWRETFKRDVFGAGREYTFENISLVGPENSDDYLRQLYGDYMVPVPESERGGHLGTISLITDNISVGGYTEE